MEGKQPLRDLLIGLPFLVDPRIFLDQLIYFRHGIQLLEAGLLVGFVLRVDVVDVVVGLRVHELVVHLGEVDLHFLRQLALLNRNPAFVFAHVVLHDGLAPRIDPDLLALPAAVHLSKPEGALVNVYGKVLLVHFLVQHALPVELSVLKLAEVPQPPVVLDQDPVLLAGLKRTAACGGIELIILPRPRVEVAVVEEALADGPVPHVILKFPDVLVQFILRVLAGRAVRTAQAIFDELADPVLLALGLLPLLLFERGVDLLLTLRQLPHLAVEEVAVLVLDDVEDVELRVRLGLILLQPLLDKQMLEVLLLLRLGVVIVARVQPVDVRLVRHPLPDLAHTKIGT